MLFFSVKATLYWNCDNHNYFSKSWPNHFANLVESNLSQWSLPLYFIKHLPEILSKFWPYGVINILNFRGYSCSKIAYLSIRRSVYIGTNPIYESCIAEFMIIDIVSTQTDAPKEVNMCKNIDASAPANYDYIYRNPCVCFHLFSQVKLWPNFRSNSSSAKEQHY